MNWDVVKKLVADARSIEKEHNKNFRFTLTTNGMLIDDEVIDFLNKEMSNLFMCDKFLLTISQMYDFISYHIC